MDSSLGYAGAAVNTSAGSVSLEALGYFGGKITIDDTEGRHEGLHGEELDAQKDILLSLGYGRKMMEPGLYGGLKVGYYTSSLIEEYSSQAIKADAGFLMDTALFEKGHKNIERRVYSPGINFGLSFLNMGPGVSYTERADPDPLPFMMKSGLSYPVRFDNEHSALFTADVTYEYVTEKIRGGGGIEYINGDTLFLRAGYCINYEIRNFTWGAGLRYEGFMIDYSMGLTSAMNNEHTVMVKYDF